MSSTYDLAEKAREIASTLIDSGGVAEDWLLDEIDDYLESAPSKVDGLHFVIQRLKGEVDWLRGQEKALAARRRSAQNGADALRGLALTLLEAHRELTGETKIKGRAATAYLSHSETLSFSPDPTAWPPDLTKTTYSLDKVAAKARLKAGEEIENMEIVQTVSVGFRS